VFVDKPKAFTKFKISRHEPSPTCYIPAAPTGAMAPPFAAFSPLAATRRPLKFLLVSSRSSFFPSFRPSSLDLHPSSIGSLRCVPGPPRPNPGSPLTLSKHTHTQHRVSQLNALTALPSRPTLPLPGNNACPNFGSNGYLAGKCAPPPPRRHRQMSIKAHGKHLFCMSTTASFTLTYRHNTWVTLQISQLLERHAFLPLNV
jgi:hypothetical protein